MHDVMYSLANYEANFSLIGRRVCVINRSDVKRESIAFCTSTRNQIRLYVEQSRACSVCLKKGGKKRRARARVHGQDVGDM